MNLSKRITLTSSVILVFFFFTVVVFLWSNKISSEKVRQLQSVIRSQYLVSDISKQLVEDAGSLRTLSSGLNQEIDEVQALTHRVSLLVFLLSAVIALVLTTLLIRYTQMAFKQLRRGTREWSAGNLSYRARISGKGDLSELGNAFNGMAAKLRKTMEELNRERERADKANQAKSGFLPI